MKIVKKYTVLLIKKTDLASALAVRLTKFTGKSKVPLHPKHFITNDPWFLEGVKKSDTVVDLGAGNGQNSIKIARKCKKVISLEIDQNLVKLAKIQANNQMIKNIEYQETNLEKNLNLKTGSVDRVIFIDVLEHLVKRDAILKEIHRILKKSGKLYVGVPNRETSWKKFQRSAGIDSSSDPDHKIEFSQKSIVNLLKRNKFKIKKIGYGKYDIPFRGIVDVLGAFSLSFYKYVDTLRARKVVKSPMEASGFEIVAEK